MFFNESFFFDKIFEILNFNFFMRKHLNIYNFDYKNF